MFPYLREHYSLPECLDTQWLSVRLLLHYHRKDESPTVQRIADGVELVDQVGERLQAMHLERRTLSWTNTVRRFKSCFR